jgi:putative isomerase
MTEGTRFIDLHSAPFGRKGSFFILQQSDTGLDHFGASDLWVGTTRSTGYGYSGIETTNRVMKIRLEKDGLPVPFAVSNTPGEIVLESDQGAMHICISEHTLLQFHSVDGLSLSLTAPLSAFHSAVRDMLDGTWTLITCMSAVNWLFVPVNGTSVMDAPYDWRAMRNPYMHGTWLPDENGVLDLSVEEFEFDVKRRSAYPDYQASVAAVLKEFEEYRDTCMPPFAGEFGKSRDLAAWMIWSHTRVPAPHSLIKREMVTMMHQLFGQCYCWQQAFQAIAHSKNASFAWDLLQSVFDYQSAETGQIPDHIDEINITYLSFKPPIYGVALNWLMDRCDLSIVSTERKELLYGELSHYYRFFFEYRDLDHDGLPEYHLCDETGCEDTSMCIKGLPLKCPELAAYLVAMADALSRLAALLGREAEAKTWDEEAAALAERMLRTFWTGKRFIAFRAGTDERIETGSISFFTPLVMGKRLPKDIADILVSELFRENVHISPYGVPSEALDSPYFEHGWSKGTIQSPTTCLVVLGLAACGRGAEAQDIASRYARTLQKSGMYHMIDPITGRGNDKAIGINNVQYWAAWTAAVLVILAGYIC